LEPGSIENLFSDILAPSKVLKSFAPMSDPL